MTHADKLSRDEELLSMESELKSVRRPTTMYFDGCGLLAAPYWESAFEGYASLLPHGHSISHQHAGVQDWRSGVQACKKLTYFITALHHLDLEKIVP